MLGLGRGHRDAQGQLGRLRELGFVRDDRWSRRRAPPEPPSNEPPPARVDPQANALSLESVRRLIAEGRGRVALALHEKLANTRPDWQLTQRDMLALIDALHKEGARAESIPVLVELVQRFPELSQRGATEAGAYSGAAKPAGPGAARVGETARGRFATRDRAGSPAARGASHAIARRGTAGTRSARLVELPVESGRDACPCRCSNPATYVAGSPAVRSSRLTSCALPLCAGPSMLTALARPFNSSNVPEHSNEKQS